MIFNKRKFYSLQIGLLLMAIFYSLMAIFNKRKVYSLQHGASNCFDAASPMRKRTVSITTSALGTLEH